MADCRRLRILIVDDDVITRELAGLLLTREGYVTEEAESGEAALEKLRGEGADVILADLQMPEINGKMLAQQARALSGNIRIFAMSASAAEGEILEGFDGFLRKPFTVEALNLLLAEKAALPSIRYPRSSARKVLLDEKIYLQLASSMPKGKLSQLYSFCIEDTKRRIGSIQEAAHGNDDGSCRRQAHAIKGSCSMLGAKEIEALAESIEREGIGANLASTIQNLLQACNRLEGMLIERGNTSAETQRRSQG